MNCEDIMIRQHNVAHRTATHDAMMAWLGTTKQLWIICLQEPYIYQKGMTKLPPAYTAYWSTRQTTTHKSQRKTNTAIIAPKVLNGYMVSQNSDTNCTTVRFECMKISVVSLYCSIHDKMSVSTKLLRNEVEAGRQVITCADTNAHHQLWGSRVQRNQQTTAFYRGKELMEIMDEQEMTLCNILPQLHTYVSDIPGKSSHIDITFVADKLAHRIMDWMVHEDTCDSDHRYITFTVTQTTRSMKQEERSLSTPWKNPTEKMHKIMIQRLSEFVTSKRKLRNVEEIEEYVQLHTSEIQRALNTAFKKRTSSRKHAAYWWTEEIAEAYQKMKAARKRKGRYGYESMKIEFNTCRKHFRYLMKKTKAESWQKFTTSIEDPWAGLMKIMKVSNCGKSLNRTLCDTEGNYSNDLKETLITLSSSFYPPPAPVLQIHDHITTEVESRLLHQDCMHVKITKEEVRMAVGEMSKATAPGFDTITNNVIQHLVTKGGFEQQYIRLFDECLKQKYFPMGWKIAKIVLIPKVHTIADSVKALRPISLTSALGKLFERIILARISHYMQLSNKISPNQHAYRKGFSTQTALHQVFGYVHEALEEKKLCIAVFLDISGAFDRTWHIGILYKLLEYGVPENLVSTVKSFLTGRSAIFQQGGEEHEVSMKQGCPQGGVLSPALWNVLFNDMLGIKSEAGDNTQIVAYADDAVILCKAKTVASASKSVNEILKKVHQWSIENRVVFNSSKLATMTFYGRSRNRPPPPSAVYFNGFLIKEVTRYKYLGLLVDNKLRWKDHIISLISRMENVTRMLRGAVRQNWGIRMGIMRTLYHAILMPIMTYGITVWGWRAQTLEVQQWFNKVIRAYCLMSTRCLKSTANIMLYKMMKTSDFSQILQNTVRKVTLMQLRLYDREDRENREGSCGERQTGKMRCFHDKCNSCIRYEKNVEYDDINEFYRVHPAERMETLSVVHDKFTAIWKSVHVMGWCIYTDASASSYGMGWAFVAFHNGFCVAKKYSAMSKCSVFEAEAYAMFQAICFTEGIQNLKEREKIEVRTDALSVILALNNIVTVDPMLVKIKNALRKVHEKGINIVFVWVPGHNDIFGNVMADQSARHAVDSNTVHKMNLHARELVRLIKAREKIAAQEKWEEYDAVVPKMFLPELHHITAFLKCAPSVFLMQLVTGHTRLNKFAYYVHGIVDSPMCTCNEEEESMEHYLFRCSNYDTVREKIWPNFVPSFSYITSDWEKLDLFISESKRFSHAWISKSSQASVVPSIEEEEEE